MPKHYYQIGEIANMLGVKRHTLRYWESEFPVLKPRKNSGGKRIYTSSDIDLLKKIKYLLYDQNFSIEGARKKVTGGEEVEIKESVTNFPVHNLEIKKRIANKIEKIQDRLIISPAASEKQEKKRQIREKVKDICELLGSKKKKQDVTPASLQDSCQD
jgi:DNA-binding transcriptional MerR regulator